jgi:hypothetical protein
MKLLIDHWSSNKILISQIDWADTTFRMTYDRPIPPLAESIRQIGLLHRPLLQKKNSDRYRVVSGYRRLWALLKNKEKSLLCSIAPEETDQKDLLLYNFHDNLDRGFNPVEQVLVVKRLAGYMPKQDLLQNVLPLLSLPAKEEILARTLKLSEVSPIYLPALLRGRLLPEIIEIVLQQFHSTADLILALFVFFRWSFQKQKEFLADLTSLSHREGQTPESILTSPAITELLHPITGTPQQKGEVLRKTLRNRLFPILRETELLFQEKCSAIKLDQRTRIMAPPYFEGGQYGLEIKFSSSKELRASLNKTLQAIELGDFDGLP